MKKIYLLYAITILFFFSASGQNFYRGYDIYPYGSAFTKIERAGNDGLIMSGLKQQDSLLLLKTDRNGVPEWAKLMKDTTSHRYLVGLAYTTNHDIVICLSFQLVPAVETMALIRLNDFGDTLWCKHIAYPSSNQAIGLMAVENGAVLMVGGGCAGSNLALKIDSLGNIIWGYKYNPGFVATANSCDLAKNGDYLIGLTWSAPPTAMGFMRLDPDGNLKWFKKVNSLNTEIHYTIDEDTKGNILAVGTTKGFSADSSYEGFVLKLDSMGNEIWARTMNMGVPNYGFTIQSTAGGHLIGSVVNYPTGVRDQWMISKFSEQGDWSWSTEFGNYNNSSVSDDRIFEMLICDKNDVYMVGTMYSDGMSLVKSDTLAAVFCNNTIKTPTITPVSFTYNDLTSSVVRSTVSLSLVPFELGIRSFSVNDTILCNGDEGIKDLLQIEKIKVYPNPCNDVFLIIIDKPEDNASIIVRNISGQIIYKRNQISSDHLNIDASSWSKGMYFLELRSKDKNIFRKIILQ